MHEVITRLLFAGALACSLAACGTAATTAKLPGNAEENASCRETGLTDAKDSRMGQLDCSPRPVPGATGTK